MTKDALYMGLSIAIGLILAFTVAAALFEVWRGSRRAVRVTIHPPGPPRPAGLNDSDVTESGYTFGELDALEKGREHGA